MTDRIHFLAVILQPAFRQAQCPWLRKLNARWLSLPKPPITKNKKMKTEHQKILNLEQRIRFLEHQKSILEEQLETAFAKNEIFDMMIENASRSVASTSSATETRSLSLPKGAPQPPQHPLVHEVSSVTAVPSFLNSSKLVRSSSSRAEYFPAFGPRNVLMSLFVFLSASFCFLQ
jgi:hypothetical protein